MDEWAAYMNGDRARVMSRRRWFPAICLRTHNAAPGTVGAVAQRLHTPIAGDPCSSSPRSRTMGSLSEKDDQRGDDHLTPYRRHGH